jgi:carboxypeptidase PM20D1
VVPGAVSAVLDCRLLPGTTPEQVIDELTALTGDRDYLSWRVLQSFEGNVSDWDDPFYRAIARNAVDGHPERVAGPVISVGFTDSIFLRPKGVAAYGMVPIVITEEGLRTMHGHDERIATESVRDGLRTLFSILVDAAAVP